MKIEYIGSKSSQISMPLRDTLTMIMTHEYYLVEGFDCNGIPIHWLELLTRAVEHGLMKLVLGYHVTCL
jgi:hypothetical protein